MYGWTALVGGTSRQLLGHIYDGTDSWSNCQSRRRVAQYGVSQDRKRVLQSRLLSAKQLYSSDLIGHTGCVNALEFSKETFTGSGSRWLVSGGDDRRVLIWDMDQLMSDGQSHPMVMEEEHYSNIFALQFSMDNSLVFSGGNDQTVCAHDLTTRKLVNCFIRYSPVYGLSAHPENRNLLAAAFHAGQVRQYDLRDLTSSLLLARATRMAHSVQHHPLVPNLVLITGTTSGTQVYDLRQPMEPMLQFDNGALHAKFSINGDQILAVHRRRCPTLHCSSDPKVVLHLDHPTYYNSCTTKSCCFAGDSDQLAVSGSDDFNVYVWQVPQCLKTYVESHGENGVGCVSHADMVLRGHRSVANQVRFERYRNLLVSSGVEKVVKVWSLFPLAGSQSGGGLHDCDAPTPRLVHSLGQYRDLGVREDDEDTAEEPRLLAYFDTLIQREVCSDEESDTDDEEASLFYNRVSPLFDLLEKDASCSYSEPKAKCPKLDTLESASESSSPSSSSRNSPSRAFLNFQCRQRTAITRSLYLSNPSALEPPAMSPSPEPPYNVLPKLPNTSHLRPVSLEAVVRAGRLLHQRGPVPAGTSLPPNFLQDVVQTPKCLAFLRLILLEGGTDMVNPTEQQVMRHRIESLRKFGFILYVPLERCCQLVDWEDMKYCEHRASLLAAAAAARPRVFQLRSLRNEVLREDDNAIQLLDVQPRTTSSSSESSSSEQAEEEAPDELFPELPDSEDLLVQEEDSDAMSDVSTSSSTDMDPTR